MRIAIAILGAALACGCKDRSKPPPVPPAAGSAQEPASPAFKQLPPTGSAGAPEPTVLDLPRASRSAPKKTTKPLDKAAYEKMSGPDYPGWTKDIRLLDAKALEVRYKSATPPILSVTIAASPCFDCIPMELPKWKAKEDALKNLLLPELRERKDTVFEVGEVKLAGAPLIYTYQLAHGYVLGEDQNRQGPYSHAYTVYHNDGINQIRVTAQYADQPVATRDELVNLAPRDDLQKIALAFLDAYTHAW
ncbi:MAG TPA: hypothetical protein VNO30_30015 [Kofleriaceae bacterium]|nr:hypothetical protein [Kofleriaceae bacterium]